MKLRMVLLLNIPQGSKVQSGKAMQATTDVARFSVCRGAIGGPDSEVDVSWTDLNGTKFKGL